MENQLDKVKNAQIIVEHVSKITANVLNAIHLMVLFWIQTENQQENAAHAKLDVTIASMIIQHVLNVTIIMAFCIPMITTHQYARDAPNIVTNAVIITKNVLHVLDHLIEFEMDLN